MDRSNRVPNGSHGFEWLRRFRCKPESVVRRTRSECRGPTSERHRRVGLGPRTGLQPWSWLPATDARPVGIGRAQHLDGDLAVELRVTSAMMLRRTAGPGPGARMSARCAGVALGRAHEKPPRAHRPSGVFESAKGGTRTLTGYPTRSLVWRVYQFRHLRGGSGG